MSNLKAPPHHSFIETEDGSLTLFSEKFQEACHSTSGAKAETILHYINGCKIIERIEDLGKINILEVGFGLGVGFLTTLEKLPVKTFMHFVSLELDRDLLEWFRAEHPEFNLKWQNNCLCGSGDNYQLEIIAGDARVALPLFMKDKTMQFHAIYQDAFSPKKNPALWTKEWFSLLKSISHEEVILSTYSASTSIRKSLHETGWKIQSGEKFGPKRTSTRASLQGTTSAEILLQLERSPVAALSDLQIDPNTGKIIL
jgi:tRNA U34 5-methylaminomethyl-2-thiouridine-forming methyltransferase MnmC